MIQKTSEIIIGNEGKSGNKQQIECSNFDDAIEMTGFGKFNLMLLMFCSFVCVSFILETLSFSFILPASQCDLDLSLTEKGWLGAIPFIGLASSSYSWGFFADRYGRKRILSISMTVGAIFGALSTFSPDKITFGVLRFIASAFFAAADSVIFPFFGEFMPKRHVDWMISILTSFLVSGAVYGTLIAWAILSLDFNYYIPFLDIEFRPWRLLVLVYVFPFIISSIGIHFLPESPKFLISVGKTEESLAVLKNIYHSNTSLDRDSFNVKSLKSEQEINESGSNQALQLFKFPYIKYVTLTSLCYFFIFYCSSSFFLWLPDIGEAFNIGLNDPKSDGQNFCGLLSIRGENMRSLLENSTVHETDLCVDKLSLNAYLITIWISLSMAVFTIIVSGLLKVTSKKNILAFTFIVCAATSLILHWIHLPALMWVLIAVTQLVGSLTGVLNAYAVEIYPTNLRSMGICVMGIVGRLGSIIGTNITGILLDYCCPANFFLFGFILIGAFVCSMFLPTRRKTSL